MRARMHGATATTAATTPMHFRTHTRSRSRALSTDCDHCRSSTIPRLVPLALARPPHHSQSQSFPSPTPPLTRARAFSAHNFLSLANFSCLFRIALSLLPTARLSLSTTLDISPRIPLLSCTVPPPFSPPNTSLLHTVHPPSFLSVHRFPWLSLLLIFFSSPIPSLPVPRPFLLASFLPTRLFPSRRPPPPPSPHGTLVNRHGSLCSSLLSFLPFFFHHLSRERNALGAVERERESAMSERRELGGGKERPLFSRPQRGMGYRGPIMDLSVGCCWCCCNCLRSSEPSCCS